MGNHTLSNFRLSQSRRYLRKNLQECSFHCFVHVRVDALDSPRVVHIFYFDLFNLGRCYVRFSGFSDGSKLARSENTAFQHFNSPSRTRFAARNPAAMAARATLRPPRSSLYAEPNSKELYRAGVHRKCGNATAAITRASQALADRQNISLGVLKPGGFRS